MGIFQLLKTLVCVIHNKVYFPYFTEFIRWLIKYVLFSRAINLNSWFSVFLSLSINIHNSAFQTEACNTSAYAIINCNGKDCESSGLWYSSCGLLILFSIVGWLLQSRRECPSQSRFFITGWTNYITVYNNQFKIHLLCAKNWK